MDHVQRWTLYCYKHDDYWTDKWNSLLRAGKCGKRCGFKHGSSFGKHGDAEDHAKCAKYLRNNSR